MEKELIFEVKKKRGFSHLPDSLIERALVLSHGEIKSARALLRKYFAIFLTNKVLKIDEEDILKIHISSKDRDYSSFYKLIFENKSCFKSIIDLGCGINGFSYKFIKDKLKEPDYIGVEATGQLVNKMNLFFERKGFVDAKALCIDIFDLEKIEKIIVESKSPRAILLLQTLDALEGFEKNFSKKLISMINKNISGEDLIVISMSMKTISGKNSFETKRTWLREFLKLNFVLDEFLIGNERIFSCRKKS